MFVYRLITGVMLGLLLFAVSIHAAEPRCYVFYNNSAFDGHNPAASTSDDAAIATDKSPLTLGTTDFDNYTSFSRGINGIMVDLDGPVGAITADDFIFTMGNTADRDAWAAAPEPASITLRSGAGYNGMDRVTIRWADGEIRKQWLKIKILATPATGLPRNYVFYFGNAVGETGDTPGSAKVDATDEIAVRTNPRNFLKPAAIDDPHDFNRDGKVDATDAIIARNNATAYLNELKMFTVESCGQVEFKPEVDIASGSVVGVSSLDAKDIDGDNLPDVAVIEGGKHASGEAFAWFKGPAIPGGSWSRYEFNTSAPLKPFLGAAKLADMDGDGDNDLVISSDMHSGGTKDADVLVFINPRPSGNVYGPWSYHYVADGMNLHHINDMEIADLDADGKLDIVVRSLEPNDIIIFFQNSISSWTRKTIPTNLSESEGLAVGLMNDDNKPDIMFTGYLLRSPANPRTQSYTKIAIDAAYHTVNQNTKEAVGDIDSDGLLDLILSPAEAYRGGLPHDLAWYKNPGGDLTSHWTKHVVLANTNDTHTVKLARINGDDALDIVTGVAWGSRSVKVYYNDGGGTFSTVQTVDSGKGLYSGVVVDIGNDGDMDIVGQETYANSSRPWLYESRLDEGGGECME